MSGHDFSGVRLICSDIDGTLLKGTAELPKEIKHEILRLHEQGIVFTFSTGRMPYEVEHLFEGIPNNVPYVAGNGAIVKSGTERIVDRFFCAGPLKPLADKYSDLGVTVIFTVQDEERPYRLTPWAVDNVGLFLGLDHPADDSVWQQPLQRMFFYHPEGKHLDACWQDLQKYNALFTASFQNPKSIHIAPFGCTKASGVQVLSRLLGIPREQILCVGDADNDIEMVAYAGVGAAVANASTGLRAVADYVSDKSCAEGVEEILKCCGRNTQNAM